MPLTADQELRKELLLSCLEKEIELEAAIAMAAEMESFILEGRSLRKCRSLPDLPPAPVEQPATEQAPPQAASASGSFGKGSRKRRWSAADDARLKELWHSRVTLEEIAEELNRTTPSLYSRARALGMSKRAPRPQAGGTKTGDAAGGARSTGGQGNAKGSSLANGKHPANDAVALPNGKGQRIDAAAEHCRYKGRPPAQPKLAPAPKLKRNGGGHSGRVGRAAAPSQLLPDEDLSVEPVIQFLRSRDYSIVRVGKGQFKLDGRRILTADQLREKANQVRKTLGQPPFATLAAESVSY